MPTVNPCGCFVTCLLSRGTTSLKVGTPSWWVLPVGACGGRLPHRTCAGAGPLIMGKGERLFSPAVSTKTTAVGASASLLFSLPSSARCRFTDLCFLALVFTAVSGAADSIGDAGDLCWICARRAIGDLLRRSCGWVRRRSSSLRGSRLGRYGPRSSYRRYILLDYTWLTFCCSAVFFLL